MHYVLYSLPFQWLHILKDLESLNLFTQVNKASVLYPKIRKYFEGLLFCKSILKYKKCKKSLHDSANLNFPRFFYLWSYQSKSVGKIKLKFSKYQKSAEKIKFKSKSYCALGWIFITKSSLVRKSGSSMIQCTFVCMSLASVG